MRFINTVNPIASCRIMCFSFNNILLCSVKSIVTTPLRDYAKFLKFDSYKVRSVRAEVATSRLTKPPDYPRVKLGLLIRVVGCKHGDLSQSSADRFDYGDNLFRPLFLILLLSWLIRFRENRIMIIRVLNDIVMADRFGTNIVSRYKTLSTQ